MAQTDTTNPADPVILAAQQDKAKSDALKSAADAKTAAIGAEVAAAKASLGTFPDSGTTGAVDVKTDGGKAEATLLAAAAASKAASKIVAGLPAASIKEKVIRIYAGSERPTLDHWAGFNLRLRLLQTGIVPEATTLDKNAVSALTDVKFATTPVRAEAAPIAAIALAATTLSSIVGLFRSDYAVGGISLTPDDGQLASSVAAGLLSLATDKPSTVYLASRTTTVGADTGLLELLTPLAKQSAEAQARIAFFQERAKAVRADANAKDAKMLNAAAACDQAAAAWQLVSTGYDSLISNATTADSTGALPIIKIAAEKVLSAQLARNDLILFVQMNASVGGYYTKKNLWTTFGGEPFFVAGGVVVSYALVGGAGGETIAAGVIPVHGGYVRAPDVAAAVNGEADHAGRDTH